MAGNGAAHGMIGGDKMGAKILFIDPATYETQKVLEGYQRTVHELLVVPETGLAYVPIYGDGIHGRNPNPGHTLCVIDLKTRPFAAEDAGKMNFYLNAVDDLLRHPDDQPSVGLVLCREKQGSNRMVLEYALRGLNKPIGVSEYQLTRALPDDLKPSLPTVEEIEREMANTVLENPDSRTGKLVREMRERYGCS